MVGTINRIDVEVDVEVEVEVDKEVQEPANRKYFILNAVKHFSLFKTLRYTTPHYTTPIPQFPHLLVPTLPYPTLPYPTPSLTSILIMGNLSQGSAERSRFVPSTRTTCPFFMYVALQRFMSIKKALCRADLACMVVLCIVFE